MGIFFLDTQIYFIKLLNMFYFFRMFSDVQFFFLLYALLMSFVTEQESHTLPKNPCVAIIMIVE
jgi:hypothetical protein